MARGSNLYSVGNVPPQVVWTVVRRDTASFRIYVTDDLKQPLNIPDWTIRADIKRAGNVVLSLSPAQDPDDKPGEFTVFLAAAESAILETGDVFDIQLSLPQDSIVWTVAQGSVTVIEDITI